MQCSDRIRTDAVTAADLFLLNSTSVGFSEQLWNSRTQLRARNQDVNDINMRMPASLPWSEMVYPRCDVMNEAITHPKRREYSLKWIPTLAPSSVTLKPFPVVLTTRAVDGIPTATQGIVKRCSPTELQSEFGGRVVVVPFVKFDLIDNCNTRLASRSAMPHVLSWASTVHCAQGCSLDSLAVDLSKLSWREPCLVYSGLSRCGLFETLFVE